ncbi:MAG: amidohydrolase, partial [Proteobacteria bacterium]|nr:amidohydrolase [Pseudomonadota bacterium]
SELSRELEEKLLSRLTSYNDWLCRTARGDGRIEPVIAADATVDTDAMVAEIRSKFETYSIKALKIHPAVNNLSPSDPSYQPIFELARELNLTVVSHGGLSGEDPEGRYCSPENFRPVLERFPGLKLVVAHLAYPHVEGLLELASEFPNLCTDISFVMTHSPLTDDRISEVVKKFGPERILFGSDFPWSDPEKDMDRLEKMKLRDGEIDMLVWENAIRIFDL